MGCAALGSRRHPAVTPPRSRWTWGPSIRLRLEPPWAIQTRRCVRLFCTNRSPQDRQPEVIPRWAWGASLIFAMTRRSGRHGHLVHQPGAAGGHEVEAHIVGDVLRVRGLGAKPELLRHRPRQVVGGAAALIDQDVLEA